jgi:hypothetical protein
MWTADALKSESLPYSGPVWRMVETQYINSTNRLADTLEEQAILEELVETSKPPIPPECAHLDFLLSTPFRYGPYPHGSRFRRALQPEGVFYASEATHTLVYENAVNTLLFYSESKDTILPAKPLERTAFTVECATARGIDLTIPDLDRDREKWTRLADYSHCQELADTAREGQIEAIRYMSVRDPDGGCNVALLSCAAFAAHRPSERQTWHISLKHRLVQFWCENPRVRYEIPVGHFARDPRM